MKLQLSLAEEHDLLPIHEASLKILSETGCVFHSDNALETLKKHGAKVEGETVYFPEELVKKAMATVPSTFQWRARNPDFSTTIGKGGFRLAPSAGNEQPWRFVLVNDKEMIKRISDESKKNILARITADPDDYAKKYERMLQKESFNVFYNAPCLVMILGSTHLKNLYVDCALAAGYLMMAATSRGLGTCWVNFATEIQDPGLKQELGIPEDCTIVAPIALGYPEKIPAAPKRKDPDILTIVA